MSGYIEAGYVAALGTLATYSASLLWRERRLVRRMREARRQIEREALDRTPTEPAEDQE